MLKHTEREHAKFACWDLSNQEVFARIQEVVNARFQAIEQEFKNADCTKAQVVSKEVFRDICNRRFLLLTDEQTKDVKFENLWNTVPLDLSGKLKYPGFLRMFTSEGGEMPNIPGVGCSNGPSKPTTPAVPGSCPPSRPKTASMPSSTKKEQAQKQSSRVELEGANKAIGPNCLFSVGLQAPAASRPCTAAVHTPPILNCKPIESKIRKSVQHCWKDILKECRAKDTDRLGEVSVEDMLAILEKFHLDLTKEEINQLIMKYDFKSVGKFSYCDFLQSCVLRFKHQEVSPMQRVVIQNPRVQNSPGPQSPTFFNAMMRIQPQILHCWRPMRRTFKHYDESGSGLLSVQDFRQVLRKYGINLSEEEFFHILEYYDKTLTSKISYNEFLRAFLQ
ncbi:EF-hand calcium-binding domain-containing protein 6 [Varanus komodoensis]|nr:EF-hand calcium-binding domain-containing protein 6 [Varanus komodoensis]